MTACLVILRRCKPQVRLINILFADEPVLAVHARPQQRILSGDTVESAIRAQKALKEAFLADDKQSVGIPALLLAQTGCDGGAFPKPDGDGKRP